MMNRDNLVGFGKKTRSRRCDNPKPNDHGKSCLGDSFEESECYATKLCKGSWEGWSHWSQCSESCGGGSRTRSRNCNDHTCSELHTYQENYEYLTHVSDTKNHIVQVDDKCNNHKCPSKCLQHLLFNNS